MTSLVDRTLGEFVVREHLSSGGFGQVYRAEQPALGREAVCLRRPIQDETDLGPRGQVGVTHHRFPDRGRIVRAKHPGVPIGVEDGVGFQRLLCVTGLHCHAVILLSGGEGQERGETIPPL